MQEDLSALFSRNMMVDSRTEYANTEPSAAWKIKPPLSTPQANPISYSITQHYHHSAHQASAVSNVQHSAGSSNGHISPEEILVQNNINPSSLSLSQLTLVQQANQDDLLRLIELW